MSHLVSPTGFRGGKTFLWNSNITTLPNNLKILNNFNNSNKGLEFAIDKLLYKNRLLAIKSVSKQNSYNNKISIKLLYYPIINHYERRRIFPLYNDYRKLLSKTKKYTSSFRKLILYSWLTKMRSFVNRFVKTKKRKNLNIFLIKRMFAGTNSIKLLSFNLKSNILLTRKISFIKKYKYNIVYKRKFFKFFKFKKRLNKFLINWNNSVKQMSGKFFSKQIEKKVGIKTNVKINNIFSYLAAKNKGFFKRSHQDIFWNKKYKFFRKKYNLAFFNVINAFFIVSKIPETEQFLLKIIQYSLFKMHKRKIRPKLFFYFLDSVLKNSKNLKKEFEAFKIVITGKLMGGTARTRSFSVGFGNFPIQSFDCNIRYEMGQLKSKYGSFGIKIFTWRKSRKQNNKIFSRKKY